METEIRRRSAMSRCDRPFEMEQYEDRAALRAQLAQRRFQHAQPLLAVKHALGMRCGQMSCVSSAGTVYAACRT